MSQTPSVNVEVRNFSLELWDDRLDARNYYANTEISDDSFLMNCNLFMVQGAPEMVEISIGINTSLNSDHLMPSLLQSILELEQNLDRNYEGPK